MSPMRIVSQAPCGSQWACTMDIYGVFWVSGVVCSGVGEVSVWEFSGYEPYHVTYDLFIGDASCINIIVVSLQDSADIQLSQIVFWLNFIRTRLAPQQTFGWLIHKRHCRHCHHTTNTFDFLGSGTYSTLLLLFFLLLLLGRCSSKKPKAPSFQIGLGWNLTGLILK